VRDTGEAPPKLIARRRVHFGLAVASIGGAAFIWMMLERLPARVVPLPFSSSSWRATAVDDGANGEIAGRVRRGMLADLMEHHLPAGTAEDDVRARIGESTGVDARGRTWRYRVSWANGWMTWLVIEFDDGQRIASTRTHTIPE
jgi:hypothetical protein